MLPRHFRRGNAVSCLHVGLVSSLLAFLHWNLPPLPLCTHVLPWHRNSCRPQSSYTESLVKGSGKQRWPPVSDCSSQRHLPNAGSFLWRHACNPAGQKAWTEGDNSQWQCRDGDKQEFDALFATASDTYRLLQAGPSSEMQTSCCCRRTGRAATARDELQRARDELLSQRAGRAAVAEGAVQSTRAVVQMLPVA